MHTSNQSHTRFGDESDIHNERVLISPGTRPLAECEYKQAISYKRRIKINI
jgi:hypothetical protein